jgi:hypothetical protein
MALEACKTWVCLHQIDHGVLIAIGEVTQIIGPPAPHLLQVYGRDRVEKRATGFVTFDRKLS